MSRSQATGLLVMTYFILLIFVLTATIFLVSVTFTSTWTTHIGGHECLVMKNGLGSAISCNWSKP